MALRVPVINRYMAATVAGKSIGLIADLRQSGDAQPSSTEIENGTECTMSNPATPPVKATAIGRAGARLLANRTLMRTPIWLYRARLGFLLGNRMLMLEHVGRKSGARRYVVLEVVGHPSPDVYVIASGFGERSQWFRNLMANPQVRVSVAGHRLRAATAHRLATAEADDALAVYAGQHPRAWAKFKNVLENTLGTTIGERDTELPMIALSFGPDAAPR